MRGHGRNEATVYVTVRHLRFPGRPIVLIGHSFVGAASVLAIAEGSPVARLVLIATPSDVVRITAEYLSDKGMPGTLATTVLRPFWWWRLGGTFLPHSPVRRIGELDIPVLILQPEHDDRVRRRHADLLSAAAGVPYHVIEGHEHTDVLGAPETVRLVLEFVGALPPGEVRAPSRSHA
jgi:alpha-beta hydrolase superfamily lysophospholipase